MNVTVTAVGGDRLVARFQAMSGNVIREVSEQIKRSTQELEGYIVATKLGGQVLKRRTGRLSRSVHSEFIGLNTPQVKGVVGTNVIYARIHEYGGVIEARNAAYLKFQVGGRWVQKKSVVMPERSFLRSALKDKAPKILSDIRAAVERGIHES
jgi:phage gpG-like protein